MELSKRGMGLVFLLIVVFAWLTAGAASKLLMEVDSIPLLLTYVSTSIFSFYLPFRWRRIRGAWRAWRGQSEERVLDDADLSAVRDVLRVLPTLCFLWFALSYTFNYSFVFTSLTDNAVMSCLSGPFTLLLSRVLLKDRFTLLKVTGVCLTVVGVVVVALEEELYGQRGSDEWRWRLLGAGLAALSALCYSFYGTYLKLRIVDEEKFDMMLCFGLMGAATLCTLWPALLVFHFTGVERLAIPAGEKQQLQWLLCMGVNALAALVSNYLWARAVVLTSAVVAAVALSSITPLSIVVDIVFFHARAREWFFYFAPVLTVVGFLAAGWEDMRTAKPTNMELDVAQGKEEEEVDSKESQPGTEVQLHSSVV